MARTYFRAEPDARRQSLIEAAARVLAERGAAGASVRTICAEAGVSPGLLRHYFDGIDALFAATYAAIGERVGATLDQAMAAAGADPRARLMAYVTASFRAPIADPDLLATWIAFWSLARSHPPIEAMHRRVYAEYLEGAEGLLRECGVAAEAARMQAVAVTALVDGLWLELCLAPGVFTPEDASAAAEGWIAKMLA